MSLEDNIQDVAFATAFPIDKVLDIYEDSFTATAAAGSFDPVVTRETINHNFGETVFLQGIHSRDGGSTWHEIPGSVPDTSGATPSFQTVEVGCYSTDSIIRVVASNWETSGQTVHYKIVAFSKE